MRFRGVVFPLGTLIGLIQNCVPLLPLWEIARLGEQSAELLLVLAGGEGVSIRHGWHLCNGSIDQCSTPALSGALRTACP